VPAWFALAGAERSPVALSDARQVYLGGKVCDWVNREDEQVYVFKLLLECIAEEGFDFILHVSKTPLWEGFC